MTRIILKGIARLARTKRRVHRKLIYMRYIILQRPYIPQYTTLTRCQAGIYEDHMSYQCTNRRMYGSGLCLQHRAWMWSGVRADARKRGVL